MSGNKGSKSKPTSRRGKEREEEKGKESSGSDPAEAWSQ